MNADRSARNKPKTESLAAFVQDKTLDNRPVKISLLVEHNDKTYEHVLEGPPAAMRSMVTKQLKLTKKYQTSKHNGKILKEHIAFGVSLRKYMQYQQLKYPTVKIPIFLRDAFSYLLRKGLAEEGLFRTDGSKAELRQLRDQINTGEHISLEDIKDVVLVADVVKQYFQELPEPLILEKFFDTFLAIDDLDQRAFQIETLRKIIGVLPQVHQEVLQELLILFYQVSLNSAVNCMSTENLAIIFSPIITWKDRNEAGQAGENVLNLIKEANKIAKVLALAIKEVHQLFPAPEGVEEDGCKPPEFTKKLVGHHAAIQALAPTADNSSVWTGDHLGVIRIWNAETCAFKRDLKPNRGMIFGMVAKDKSMWVATSNALLIIDSETGEIQQTHEGPHLSLRLVNTGTSPETIWAGGVGTVSIYNAETREPRQKLSLANDSKIKSLVSDSNNVWGIASKDIILWNANTGEKEKEVREAHNAIINDIILLGDTIWTCAGDVGIKIWNKKTLNNELQLSQGSEVLCLGSFGSHVWSGSQDETIRIWESSTLELLHQLEGFHVDGVSKISSVWTDRKTKCWAWSTSLDSSICVWDTAYKSFR